MTEKIVIIDYGSGNLRSALKSVEAVIAAEGLDAVALVSARADDIAAADRIILPGQGAFGDCMAGLSSIDGMIGALNDSVIRRGVPFFGICVGMQLLATRGHEHGVHEGLNWIAGDVVKMVPSDPSLKIPHMGWNDVTLTDAGKTHPALRRVMENSGESLPHFYFVHSFVFDCKDSVSILGRAEYGGVVPAIIGRDNIIGTQFHPEKSQQAGLDLIAGFLSWKP
jgi:glutamine amidotransferase